MAKVKNISKVNSLLLLILWALLFLSIPAHSQEHKTLEYDVSVNARIVPIFAIDADGSPVFDLKKEEIVFSVNGRKVPFEFERFQFEDREDIKFRNENRTPKSKPKVIPIPRSVNRRVIFIVIDSILNSKDGLKRSKEIATQLIQTRFSGDDFIILENTPGGGLKYIAGPESNKQKLLVALEKVSVIPEKFQKGLFTYKSINRAGSVDLSSSRSNGGETASLRKRIQKLRYKQTTRRFANSLTQLKHALKTISIPKIVFLISEGIQKGAFLKQWEDPETRNVITTFSASALTFLKDVAKAVNEGGSVLYTINPRKVEYENLNYDSASGADSLNYVAKESGGKYFEGADPEKVVKQIRKTTAAYYELAFVIPPDMRKAPKIKLKSLRSDVKLHSIKKLASEKSYQRMSQVEKKLFALNVAHQGSWSRMVAKTTKGAFKKVKYKRKRRNMIKTYEVEIPESMRGKKVEIYILRVGTGEDKIDFGFQRKIAGAVEQINIAWQKKRNHFYVIIDPEGPYCIYNKLSE